MKKLSIGFLCLLIICILTLFAGDAPVDQNISRAWNFKIEQIDLSNPEGQKYAEYLKKQQSVDADPYVRPENKDANSWSYVYGPKDENGRDTIEEKRLHWTDSLELVEKYADFYNYELLVRNKVTGETQLIGKGTEPYYISVLEILNDTHILYRSGYHDLPWYSSVHLYNRITGASSLVGYEGDTASFELDDRIYLYYDNDEDGRLILVLTDVHRLAAGKKDGKRIIARWDEIIKYNHLDIKLSQDKRFVYTNISKYSGEEYLYNRGIYDIITGEKLAFFQLPTFPYHYSFIVNNEIISETMEYISSNDEFYIIRYER